MAPGFTLPRWLDVIANRGYHGVTLFFVVSAFTLTLGQPGRAGWAAYAVRRLARVGPGYWLAGILFTIACGMGPRLVAPDGITLSDVATALLFGSVWHGGPVVTVVPGGWSVCCEIAFYLVLPAALGLIAGHMWRAVLLTVTLAVAAQFAARYAMTHGGWAYMPQYIHPLIQFPVFALGITAAVLAARRRLPRVPGAALTLLAAGIALVPFSPVAEWQMLPHLQFAGIAALAVAVAAHHPPKLLCGRLIRRVGEVSFSIYLVHELVFVPCLLAAERLVPDRDWRTLAVYLTLTAASSFGLACFTYRWIEQPAIRWASQWSRHRPGATAPQPG